MAENLIPVTKPYLPSKDKYKEYVDKIYESGWVTNNGPLVQELEKRLSDYLGVKNVILVSNGSLALHVAYKALELKGEVITTPFSFAATASTLVWEGLNPIFCDINPDTLNISTELLEEKISKNTSAIVPVHVFGNPCDVEEIKRIAEKNNLKIIYDAAHAFGVNYQGESILKYGDISTLSFHATKLFHSIEGGAIITENDELANKVRKMINFGIIDPENIEGVGTNAKMNEFEAAMGLCVLDDIEYILSSRQRTYSKYKEHLAEEDLYFQEWEKKSIPNGAYFPILLRSENDLNRMKIELEKEGIITRRYFYPSLNKVYSDNIICPISEDVSSRVLCLPLYTEISSNDVERICEIIGKIK